MQWDAIVVPRGAELQAVRRGWSAPAPAFVAIPAGRSAGAAVADRPAGERVLVLGLCGALDPALRVGDVVVYDRMIAGNVAYPLDAELTAALGAAFSRGPVAGIAAPGVVDTAAAKRALAAEHGAAAVDMEGGVLAAAFARSGGRCAMLRVVSDDAHGDLPDLRDVYTPGGDLRAFALALALLRTPARSVRFVRNAQTALRALERAASRLAALAR
jgi:hypothetical protein